MQIKNLQVFDFRNHSLEVEENMLWLKTYVLFIFHTCSSDKSSLPPHRNGHPKDFTPFE
jgi:hypothetical protein